ncbi:unnamed protein product [Ostreobium quekettii]|uniref:Fungal lipase-type domain-containing protein n=1 Tax=Ostreobium quekettii TaxID=121088 RepID=A0A8S1J709_9CHLO|nr:unnamed protein product [Ostreobium quekettii]
MIYAYNARTGLVADPFDIKSALALYDLDSIEFVHSRRTDSLAVVAWSPALVLVSFRGTSSITNILADLRAWLVVHPPPRRAHCRLRGRPRVHKGFLDSWTAGGFNQQVLKLISDVLSLPGYDRSTMRVLVTGHSLGGAIAQLAAFEISSTLKVGPCRVSCYTLGCPKVGNRAFACEYHRAVPDTWHVVNDLDVVARTPELLWYKRAGRRVVMNAKGDMIVEPVYVEFKFLSLMPAKVSVAHHLLAGYKRSVSAVASAQLVHGRGIPGHRLAVQKLLKKAHITKLLGLTEAGSCDLNSLIWPGRFRRSRGQLSTQRLASETLTDPTSTVDELEGVGMGDCMSLLHALYKAVKCWIAGLRGIDCDLDCDEEQSFEMGDRLGGGGGNGPTEKAIIMPGVGVCLYKG